VHAAPNQAELLPAELLSQYGLPGFAAALQDLHKPQDMEAHAAARRRLALQVGWRMQLLCESAPACVI
jgi:RecG-like helicase